MKRMHVHIAVADLESAIGFYSALFAAPPAVVKADYAKWMLDDPRVNFAISTRGKQPGLDHLGIQVGSKDELTDVYARLRQAGGKIIEQGHLLLCAVGKVVDRRSCRHFLGDVLHHRREHRLWRKRRKRPTPRARQDVLRSARRACGAGAIGLLWGVTQANERSPVQRPVPLHRQLGALDHSRSHPEQARCRQVPPLQRGQPANGPGQPGYTPALAEPRLQRAGVPLEVVERVCQARCARARFCLHRLRQRGGRNLSGVVTAHWGVPDPVEAKGSPAEIALAFKDTYRMLSQRIAVFAALPIRSLDRLSLQTRLEEIGRMRGATDKVAEPS